MAEPILVDPSLRGLSEAEAAARLAADGPNDLPRAARRTPFHIAVEVLKEPMMALLLAGGVLYLVLGDTREALVLLAFATLSIAITVVQESRTERILDALRDLTAPRALVLRDGRRRNVDGRTLVAGDLMILSEGDRIPADGRLLRAHDLGVDESLLTGESVPVAKRAAIPADDAPDDAPADDAPAGAVASASRPGRPGGEGTPSVCSGTLVVRGSGLAEVTATGPRSEIGRIGEVLRQVEPEAPRLRRQTRRLVLAFAVFGGSVAGLAVLLMGLLRGDWLQGLLSGIAIGMSMLPEEFPLVLTVFMAMGAWRISRARVLTRRADAIETLGSTTVLCTDKTGTLTRNRMSIAELRPRAGAAVRLAEAAAGPLADTAADLLAIGLLASSRTPHDPMEVAFHDRADMLPAAGPVPTPVREWGLRPDLLAVTRVWRFDGRPGLLAAAKGAPEAIADLTRADPQTRAARRREVEAMAAAGLRVLGVARARLPEGPVPEDPTEIVFEDLGLVGLADPLRPNVPPAIAAARAAGVRVVMITGDHPATARAVAAAAGIAVDAAVVTGDDLDRLDDAALAERVAATTVFARILPEQKLRIVRAFAARGEVVAMTGDGVNDAPSLEAAHIGIAMGGRGTDVAREAAAIVLLDDDFGAIVTALRLGRRIWDNLVKAMAFVVAVHVPIAGLALLPLVVGLPVLFGPVHIAFLEMVIDPVCSLVFEAEPEEGDVMRRPPRDPRAPLVSRGLLVWGLVQGAVGFLLVAGVFFGAVAAGMPEDEIRALSFFSLVFVIVGLIVVGRSYEPAVVGLLRRPNPILFAILAVVAAVLAASLGWDWARALFRFGPLHLDDLALTVGAGLAALLVLDVVKRFLPVASGRRGAPRPVEPGPVS